MCVFSLFVNYRSKKIHYKDLQTEFFFKRPTTFEVMKSAAENWQKRDLLSILLAYVQPPAVREKSERRFCGQYINKFILL